MLGKMLSLSYTHTYNSVLGVQTPGASARAPSEYGLALKALD